MMSFFYSLGWVFFALVVGFFCGVAACRSDIEDASRWRSLQETNKKLDDLTGQVNTEHVARLQ